MTRREATEAEIRSVEDELGLVGLIEPSDTRVSTARYILQPLWHLFLFLASTFMFAAGIHLLVLVATWGWNALP